jgi:hypothetical protein
MLRDSVLESLDLPFTVVYGQLGSLHLKINWRRLLSEPLEVVISDGRPKVLPTLENVSSSKHACVMHMIGL